MAEFETAGDFDEQTANSQNLAKEISARRRHLRIVAISDSDGHLHSGTKATDVPAFGGQRLECQATQAAGRAFSRRTHQDKR